MPLATLGAVEKRMSKADYTIKLITHSEAKPILQAYHYLATVSRGFKSGWNWGLFRGDQLLGVAIFTGLPVPEIAQGAFGLDRHDQEGLWELSRLCLHPSVQGTEHNLAGWFLSRALKALRKATPTRAVLSYADGDHHNGVVYAATGWNYYGLTDSKKDFFYLLPDGSYKKHSRGPIKGMAGEWRERSRKHRFLKVFDPALQVLWKQVSWNNGE